MIVLIDGEEVECEEIKIVFDETIVACSGAGGSHHEISGHHEITLDEDSITVDQICYDDNYEDSCYMMLNDLLCDMKESTVMRTYMKSNKEEIEHIRGLFKKI